MARDIDVVKQFLEDRRRELARQINANMRNVRVAGEPARRIGGTDEILAADSQDDIDMSLVEIRSETLAKIESALRFIEEGRYGICAECSVQITEVRLLALPFAVRCARCQETYESQRSRPWHEISRIERRVAE